MIHLWSREGNANDSVGGADGTSGVTTAFGTGLDGQGHKILGSNANPAVAGTGQTGVSILNLDLSGNAVTGIKISGGGGNLISGVDVSWDGGAFGGTGRRQVIYHHYHCGRTFKQRKIQLRGCGRVYAVPKESGICKDPEVHKLPKLC